MTIRLLVTLAIACLALVQAQECACPQLPPQIPPNEDNLGTDDTCSEHTEDNVWFTPVYFDDTLGNAVVRYRHCAVTHTQFVDTETSCSSSSREFRIDRYEIADEPICTDYRTKTIPSSRNFRMFYGRPDTSTYDETLPQACSPPADTANGDIPYCLQDIELTWVYNTVGLAYSEDGSICFRAPNRQSEECRVDSFCTANEFWCGGSSGCDPQCFARDEAGKRVDLILSYMEDGRNRVWIELELDPVDGGGSGGGGSGGGGSGGDGSGTSMDGLFWTAMVGLLGFVLVH